MCILFLALNKHPNYPVIICANRDEFHQRPTKSMHWWPKEKILAGQDLQAGGTWLGLTKQGRFAALTNYRKLPSTSQNQTKSRGHIVTQALQQNNQELITSLSKTNHDYQPFNLIYGDLTNLYCYQSMTNSHQRLTAGVHSLSNGALDDIWPKMAQGQQALSQTIEQSKTLAVESLFSIMSNANQAHPDTLPKTGVPLDWEQKLSAIFISSPEYGTRNTSIITLDMNGKTEVTERNYHISGQQSQQQHFEISN